MIEGVKTKKVNPIPDERGRLIELLRNDEEFYDGFGQVYITTAYPGVVKGWHYHKLQTDYFYIVKGMVKVVLYDSREDSPTYKEVNEFFLGDFNQKILRIPNFVMHGFKCISETEALILNCPTMPYNHSDPDELRLPAHTDEIPYDWSRKDG